MCYLLHQIKECIKIRPKKPEPKPDCNACKELERKIIQYRNIKGTKGNEADLNDELILVQGLEKKCICEQFKIKIKEFIQLVNEKTANG